MRLKTLVATSCALLLIGSSAAFAQSSDLVLGPDSKLWIDGTSNKSDWTVTVTEMDGTLTLDDSGQPARAVVTVVADKIESNKSKIMDRLMYRALKTQNHPTITYTLTTVDGQEGDSLATTGEVEVAGVTKPVPMKVQWENGQGGEIRVRGSHSMKMTDHGMKPPTAMFGALHTGDEVMVHFDVVFAPAASTSTGS